MNEIGGWMDWEKTSKLLYTHTHRNVWCEQTAINYINVVGKRALMMMMMMIMVFLMHIESCLFPSCTHTHTHCAPLDLIFIIIIIIMVCRYFFCWNSKRRRYISINRTHTHTHTHRVRDQKTRNTFAKFIIPWEQLKFEHSNIYIYPIYVWCCCWWLSSFFILYLSTVWLKIKIKNFHRFHCFFFILSNEIEKERERNSWSSCI